MDFESVRSRRRRESGTERQLRDGSRKIRERFSRLSRICQRSHQYWCMNRRCGTALGYRKPGRRQGMNQSRKESRCSMNSRLDVIRDWDSEVRKAGYSVVLLSVTLRISQRQLERFIIGRFHQTPRAWMSLLRMRQATVLLGRGYQVQEVARHLAYAGSAEFCRAFHRHFGAAPRSFLRSRSVSDPTNVAFGK